MCGVLQANSGTVAWMSSSGQSIRATTFRQNSTASECMRCRAQRPPDRSELSPPSPGVCRARRCSGGGCSGEIVRASCTYTASGRTGFGQPRLLALHESQLLLRAMARHLGMQTASSINLRCCAAVCGVRLPPPTRLLHAQRLPHVISNQGLRCRSGVRRSSLMGSISTNRPVSSHQIFLCTTSSRWGGLSRRRGLICC